MAYTRYGPFTDGGSPGISASFLNQAENFLVTVNSAATDASISAAAGLLSAVGFASTSTASVTGTTNGSATIYQFMQGTLKAFFCYYNAYRNSTATEQRITLPVAFTSYAIYVAGGGIPLSHFWLSGSSLTGKCNVITSLPSGSAAGNITNNSSINGFQYGEITSGFDQYGLGTSLGANFTAGLFVIGV